MSRITIADIAREAGVSTMTVSRVINDKGEISPQTRERVQRTIDRLGYRPSGIARSLSTNRTHTLGLVVPDITNPFFPEIVRGAEDTAAARGYSVILCNTVEDPVRERAVLELLESKRVDGIILCSARLPDAELFPLVRQHPAAVLLNRPALGEAVGSLRVDDAHGAVRAVGHLLALGRRHLGLLAGPPNSYSAQQRLEGFTLALEGAGYGLGSAQRPFCAPTEAGGYEAARALLSAHPEIDALFCYNDLVAIGALRACAELARRVPEDVAVVGCDDVRLASLVTPSLTTLRVPKYDLGQRAVQMLLGRTESREAVEDAVVKPELVVRESAPSF